MTLVEQLTRLHRDIPGCRAAVFGDMEAGTVLRACADADLRQEDHDALLAEASACLGPGAERLLARVFGQGATPHRLSQAILAAPLQTCVFLRSGTTEGEVICVSLDAGTTLEGVGATLREVARADE
ncbi:hypothetical protein CLV78_101517 [Aliiruegeria haliotis]|uniref:Roadblock/LAMTOR2 domain-containing protein n=1 Tax=Aliiruegeria haliotis TaxID=1280846 RepID=A0A2T0RZ58_9RHOB|nr:hypothetical protein [Aliiruegeria haliotis]PRY26422.1 hypothetical protein CLV78_101517 [Aliiruegeria haliotis]